MTTKLIIAAGALLAASPVMAQSNPAAEHSADDLVCQLSGDCGELGQLEATQDKPVSRGFKLARKVDTNEPASSTVISNSARSRMKAGTEPARMAANDSKPGRNRTISAAAPHAPVGRASLRVTFVTGSAELTEGGRREAEKFLAALSAPSLAGKKFRIEGHTDSVGSRDTNVELSRRRAQALVEYLANQGADASRFNVIGYGPDKPLAGLDPSAGANRRVDIVLVN